MPRSWLFWGADSGEVQPVPIQAASVAPLSQHGGPRGLPLCHPMHPPRACGCCFLSSGALTLPWPSCSGKWRSGGCGCRRRPTGEGTGCHGRDCEGVGASPHPHPGPRHPQEVLQQRGPHPRGAGAESALRRHPRVRAGPREYAPEAAAKGAVGAGGHAMGQEDMLWGRVRRCGAG